MIFTSQIQTYEKYKPENMRNEEFDPGQCRFLQPTVISKTLMYTPLF